MEDCEFEQRDILVTAGVNWEHVDQGDSWGLDRLCCPGLRTLAWNPFHTPSHLSEPSLLGLDKESGDAAPSPPRYLPEISEISDSSNSHFTKLLSPCTSATSSLCNTQDRSSNPTLQNSTVLIDQKPIVPDLKSCPHCSYKASAHGITAHLKKNHQSGSSSTVIQCAKKGEPGCEQVFKDERSRIRHRQHSCKVIPWQLFQCCCGARVRRWANFAKGHRACVSRGRDLYNCHCKAQISDFKGLEQHHMGQHAGQKGRPRKTARQVGDDWALRQESEARNSKLEIT